MGDKSKIEWTEATWNVVLGCKKVSEGCRHCYAIGMAWRFKDHPNPKVRAGYGGLTKQTWQGVDWTGKARFLPERLDQPLRWKRARRIFVNSMSDLFHENILHSEKAAVFGVMAAAQRHTFQLLTKRPERAALFFRWLDYQAQMLQRRHPGDGLDLLTHEALGEEAIKAGVPAEKLTAVAHDNWPLPNLWLGVSVESRQHLDRIDTLRTLPAAVRWLSIEPLLGPLGPLDLSEIDWVVVGGESGKGARPMHPEWVREIRDQCKAQGVAFFFKQWGEWIPADEGAIDGGDYSHCEERSTIFNLAVDGRCMHSRQSHLEAEKTQTVEMLRMGKKYTGRSIDGELHDEYPLNHAEEVK